MGEGKGQNGESGMYGLGPLILELAHMIHCIWLIFAPRGELGPDFAVKHVEYVVEGGLETVYSTFARKGCRSQHETENVVKMCMRDEKSL